MLLFRDNNTDTVDNTTIILVTLRDFSMTLGTDYKNVRESGLVIWVGQFRNDEKTQVRVFLIKFLSDKSI